MTAGYSVLELSTAVKPWLLRRSARRRGVERVTYLDPDIQVFDSLDGGRRAAARAPARRQPASHRADAARRPPPSRDRHPHRRLVQPRLCRVRRRAETPRGCSTGGPSGWPRTASSPPRRGYFVDQRWMDFAPGLVEASTSCATRATTSPTGTCAGRELRGAPATATRSTAARCASSTSAAMTRHGPQLLSKHQDRIQLERAAGCCSSSATAMRARSSARGTTDWSRAAVRASGRFRTARRSTRSRAGSTGTPRATATARPTTTSSRRRRSARVPRLPEWARGAGRRERGHALSGGAVRERGRDLRLAFPDLDGPDGSRLVAWAQVFGSATGTVPPALLPLGGGNAEDAAICPGREHRGLLQGGDGRRRARPPARSGARDAGDPAWRRTTLHPDASPEDESLRPRDDRRHGKAALQPDVRQRRRDRRRGRAAGPEDSSAAALHDRLLGLGGQRVPRPSGSAPSAPERGLGGQPARARRGGAKAARCLCVDDPAAGVAARAKRTGWNRLSGLPEGFRFLFAFDYFSVFERKNPLAAIEAFTRAFEPGSGAVR